VSDRSGPGVGETFGGYTIESLLGRGGMGSVYLATHHRLARKVALKLIVPGLADDQSFRDRFLRESQLAASLDHPNVIPIYDADEVGGVLYLAMRYVNGSSLQALITARGALSPDETVRLADQIGGALDAAHQAGLIHRDVKPANIILAASDDHAYLCDFGLAKHATSEGVTRTGAFLGTGDYCSPEQILGLTLDGRADVYALGCVLFTCIAGQPPYVRESEFAVLEAHLYDPPPSLSSTRPELRTPLDAVIAQALAKEPAVRHATAGGLAKAFRGALSDDATRAAPGNLTVRATIDAPRSTAVGRALRGRRNRVVTALVLGLIVAVALAAVLMRGSGEASTSADPSLAARRTFVDRLENVLEQSAAGRREVAAALTAGFSCSISPLDASRRIASVADNRQSILGQLGTLHGPTPRADEVVTLLQQALQHSIEADRHYRDGFLALAEPRTGCPLQQDRNFILARQSDTRATAVKRRVVTAFNPLAHEFRRREWTAAQI
jgi:hypothetical protein